MPRRRLQHPSPGRVAAGCLACLCAWWLVACSAPRAGAEADDAGLERFLAHYFTSWSAKDLAAYGACFHPRAVIQVIDGAGTVTPWRRDDFLADQARRLAVLGPVSEVPIARRWLREGDQAAGLVRWRLEHGGGATIGLDHFTLRRQGDRWLIIALSVSDVRPAR